MSEDDSYQGQLLLSAHHKPDKTITALDGTVAAILGNMVMTSPNQTFVPEIPMSRSVSVFLRQDFRFGPDDATLWPQAYLAKYPHLGCIARKPADPGVELGVMWWDPCREDFEQCRDVAIRGIGKIAGREMIEMRKLKDELRKDVIEFLQRVSKSKPLLVESCLTTMNHRWARLDTTGAEYEEKRLEVVEFQRSWLELEAALIYFRSMVKRMQTEETPHRDPISSVGTITNSATIAQEFFAAGIPVWLIRPKTTLSGDIQIVRVVYCVRVQDSVCMERLEGYPDIFQGAFTDDDHYVQQHLFARSRLMCVSWVDGKETMADISEPQSLNASQVASTSRSMQDLKAHKTRVIEPSKPYDRVKSSQSSKNDQTAAGREKFAEPKSPLTPPAISTWVAGLNKVTIWEQSIKKKQAAGQYETYVFPDPRWFLNAQETRCARLLRNWLKSRSTWMWRASYFQQRVPTMSISLWKEALHVGFGSGGKISLESSKGKHIKKMVEYFGCSLSRDGLLELPSAGATQDGVTEGEPIWKGKVVECSETRLPKGTVLTEAMWELYEINFRFDLVRLDRALTKSAEWDAEKQRERQLKIESCFPDADREGFRFGYPELTAVNMGLASDSLESRYFFARRLASLMLDWNTPIPTTITGLLNIRQPSNQDMRNFELVVAEFYCQQFYNQMGRAALAPHRLHAPTRV